MYVVYLTLYGGSKFPSLYIGSTSKENIFNGYRGSVSSQEYSEIWNAELRENPHLFGSFILKEFDDRDDALAYERELQLENDVIKNPLYVNKGIGPAKNTFWINNSGEDNPFYGRTHSQDALEKMSKAKLGKNNPMAGRTGDRCPNGRLVGEDNPFFGQSHSPVSLSKMRDNRNSKNPLWAHKDALYKIWLQYDKPSRSKCRKLFVSLGYESYDCRSIHAYFNRQEVMK